MATAFSSQLTEALQKLDCMVCRVAAMELMVEAHRDKLEGGLVRCGGCKNCKKLSILVVFRKCGINGWGEFNFEVSSFDRDELNEVIKYLDSEDTTD